MPLVMRPMACRSWMRWAAREAANSMAHSIRPLMVAPDVVAEVEVEQNGRFQRNCRFVCAYQQGSCVRTRLPVNLAQRISGAIIAHPHGAGGICKQTLLAGNRAKR